MYPRYIARCVWGKRSVSQLQEQFYLRKQLDGEIIRSHSVVLLELLEVLTTKDPRSVNDPDRVLAEHFAEGLRDRIFLREIKQQLRQRPDIPCIDLREEVIRWSEEEERQPPAKQRSAGIRGVVVTESVSHCAVPQTDDCMDKVSWTNRRRHWPTYRSGLVSWRSTCNPLSILQSKDNGGLCSLQKMGNPFAITVGSSDTLAGSAKVAQCGEIDSIQVAVSEIQVTQMCLGAETL